MEPLRRRHHEMSLMHDRHDSHFISTDYKESEIRLQIVGCVKSKTHSQSKEYKDSRRS